MLAIEILPLDRPLWLIGSVHFGSHSGVVSALKIRLEVKVCASERMKLSYHEFLWFNGRMNTNSTLRFFIINSIVDEFTRAYLTGRYYKRR